MKKRKTKITTIWINGKDHEFKGSRISYEQILETIGKKVVPGYSVTANIPRSSDSGCIINVGEEVKVKENLHIMAMVTGSA